MQLKCWLLPVCKNYLSQGLVPLHLFFHGCGPSSHLSFLEKKNSLLACRASEFRSSKGMPQPLSAWVGATRFTRETPFLTSHIDTSWPRREASTFTHCLPSALVTHAPGRSLTAELCGFLCQLMGQTAEPCCLPVWLILVGSLSSWHSLLYAGSQMPMPLSFKSYHGGQTTKKKPFSTLGARPPETCTVLGSAVSRSSA